MRPTYTQIVCHLFTGKIVVRNRVPQGLCHFLYKVRRQPCQDERSG